MRRVFFPIVFFVMLLLFSSAAAAFLADDFSSPYLPKRVVVGGEVVPTPPGAGKGWDGGRGWRSRMRLDAILPQYYGRRDYVIYTGLEPGLDLPLEGGTLEVWVRRDNADALPSISDNLFQFLDAGGETLATLALDYGDAGRLPNLNLWKVSEVWGEVLPIPPIAVGEWVHLAFTWGPHGAADNRVFLNGRELTEPGGARDGDFSIIIRRTRALRLGLGWEDSDPAYHTVLDEFAFSGEVKRSFDLGRSLIQSR